MKILLIHQYARPPRVPGGSRHHLLAKGLARAGHDVTVICSQYDFKSPNRLSDHAEEDVDGVRFFWLDAGFEGMGGMRARLKGMIGFSRAATAKARALNEDWDLVISTSPHPFQAYAAERFAAKRGIPFLLEIRDLWPLSMRDVAGWKPWHPGWIVMRYMEKHLYRNSAHIVTVLPGSQKWIIESGGDPDAISCVPNGVDGGLLETPHDYPADDGPFRVIYTGAHGAANGLDTAVRAAHLAASDGGARAIELVLVGQGPTKPALQALASEIGATNVDFRDPVPKDAVHDEIGRCHATLIHLVDAPTFRYGVSPNKLFDYLLAARPVMFAISSSNNPVDEVNAGVTLAPEDPAAMARAMRALADTPREDRIAMGERGRDYVMKNHEWKALGAQFEAAARAAVTRGGRR